MKLPDHQTRVDELVLYLCMHNVEHKRSLRRNFRKNCEQGFLFLFGGIEWRRLFEDIDVVNHYALNWFISLTVNFRMEGHIEGVILERISDEWTNFLVIAGPVNVRVGRGQIVIGPSKQFVRDF